MSVSVNVTLTVPLETFHAVRAVPYPEHDQALVNQVAYDTTYAIIEACRGELVDVKHEPNGDVSCRAARMIRVRIMKLSDGKHFYCDIHSDATARELACKIHDEHHIPLLKQVLMFQGNVLFRRDAERSIDLVLDKVCCIPRSPLHIFDSLHIDFVIGWCV